MNGVTGWTPGAGRCGPGFLRRGTVASMLPRHIGAPIVMAREATVTAATAGITGIAGKLPPA